MSKIDFGKDLKEIIEAPGHDKRILLTGPTGCGKTSVLQHRYLYMVESLEICSDGILVLLPNSSHIKYWDEKISMRNSSTLRRVTFYGFIQEEMKVYYPLVLKNCSDIVNRRIKPIFIDFEASRFLLSRVIQWQRENKGAFSGITSDNAKIAADLSSNLIRASVSGIPCDEIGERLSNSLELKDDAKIQALKESQEIIKAFRKKCLEIGVFDYALTVELFNACLMQEKLYKEQLKGRIQHLIVDNIEECSPVEVDLIEYLITQVDTCLLGYNSHSGCGFMKSGHEEYVVNKLVNNSLIERYSIPVNAKSYNCSGFMNEFSDMLFDNIESRKGHKVKNPASIERTPPVDLRSDMLERVGLKVVSLVASEGLNPSDITILSTYADPVTEYVISDVLAKHGIKLKNLSRKNKFMDNEVCQALVTLAQVCHYSCGLYPSRDQLRVMFKLAVGFDPIRSSILAGEACKGRPWVFLPDIEAQGLKNRFECQDVHRYQYLKSWVDQYISSTITATLDDFFYRAFLELILSDKTDQHDILQVGRLIDSARTFCEVVSRFGSVNVIKGYILTILGGMASGELVVENEESEEAVLLAMPQTYLSKPLTSKVIILTSVSSKNWAPRNAKELTNAYVLAKTWNKDMVYSEELEEYNQKKYLAMMMRAVLKRCGERLITFESNLSAGGYENDGILSEYLDEILS